jgi:adenylate cyclase
VSLSVILNFGFQTQSSIFSGEVLASLENFLSSPVLTLAIVYWSFAVMFGLSILHINDKFGKGVLINLLTGKYNRPRKEVKIFMFLDLIASTTIAEQLGAQRYSSLIRDFFFDLDEVINNTYGSIFQFIGDEVVVIWDVKSGVRDANCVRLFFLAEDKIQSLRDRYKEKFGLCPEFKAGLHYGEVIITEVGGSKQEITYHGDPINTTARIRSACRETKNKLLISKDLLDIMPSANTFFSIQPVGVFKLRGKKTDIQLCGIERNL